MPDRLRPQDEVDLEERIHRYGRLLSGIPLIPNEPPEITARRARFEAERAVKIAELKALIHKREQA